MYRVAVLTILVVWILINSLPCTFAEGNLSGTSDDLRLIIAQQNVGGTDANDRAFWDSVKDSKNPDELRAYLQQFPTGVFAPLARMRLKAIESTVAGHTEINRDDRFIAYSDGTVLDTQTKLMWAAKDNGGDIDWQNAKNYCENYRGGGYTDWRMPTQSELIGLYNQNKPRPMACDKAYNNRVETVLIDISCYLLWASETDSFFFHPTAACVSLFDGGRSFIRQSYNAYMRALPVRSVKDVSKSILKSDGSPYMKAGSTTQIVPQSGRDKEIAYVPKESIPGKQVISLRSKPDGNISQSHYQALLRKYDFFDNMFNKNGSFQNDFIDNGNGTITDRATGLMWQKGGSSRGLYLIETEDYIKKMNRDGFAGYRDWRIPTTDEIVSLMKQTKNSWRDLYIDSMFDKTQYACWSSDVGIFNISTGHYNAWFVSFEEGTAKQERTRNSVQSGTGADQNPEWRSISRYVRAVRSLQQSNP